MPTTKRTDFWNLVLKVIGVVLIPLLAFVGGMYVQLQVHLVDDVRHMTDEEKHAFNEAVIRLPILLENLDTRMTRCEERVVQ